jgi:hypothetical protein
MHEGLEVDTASNAYPTLPDSLVRSGDVEQSQGMQDQCSRESNESKTGK